MPPATSTDESESANVPVKALIIDDERSDYLVIEGLLRSVPIGKYELTWAANFKDGLREMITNAYDVCLLDYRLGPDDGLDLLREATKQGCIKPIILLTGFGDYELDLKAMSGGAVDFLIKDHLEGPILERSMRYAIEHWRAKQRLETSIREKEVLLKEVHHRVKNNLQVISSLLNLQARAMGDDVSASALQVCCERVRSIALVHDKLYRSYNLEAIDFTDYARSLLSELSHSYGVDPERVQVTVEGDVLILSVTHAVPLGLILHELVSNSLKHAFPENRKGSVRVKLKKLSDGTAQVSVADNGIGMNGAVDKTRSQRSLGMELVNTLVAQIRGTLDTIRKDGMEFVVTFSLTKDAH